MIGVDPQTERAVRAFLQRISGRYEVVGARLYGSRARKTHASDSDADLAVFLKGSPGDVLEVGVDLAGVAFDVMLDTEVLVAPIPIWEDDWSHAENYSNPRLLETIRSEGIPV